MRKLFLDDVREPWDRTWDVVRDFKAFKAYIEEYGVPDIIAFDHDLEPAHYEIVDGQLGQFERTGETCATWLIEHAVKTGQELPKTVIVHSWNTDGAKRIARMFQDVTPTLKFPYPCTPLKELIAKL